jgi:protoporphyrinogen oxidase
VTAARWLRGHLGERAYNRTFGAQLRAKFGPRAEEIAMVWFWNKVYLRTQSRPGLLASERLGYFDGSFRAFTQSLVDAARSEGAKLHTAAAVQSVEPRFDKSGFIVQVAAEALELDALVVTTPAPILARLLPSLPSDYRERLTATTYQGAACVLLRLDRNLTDTYWLNIADRSLPFTVVVEHTNFIGPEHYDGNHYVYVNTYVEPDHRYMSMSDDELLNDYLGYLPRLNPAFSRDWLLDAWVFRTPVAQPIIGLNYAERMPSHRAPLPGLYLATMSQIYPEDRGTNYAVALGEKISAMLDEDLSSRT